MSSYKSIHNNLNMPFISICIPTYNRAHYIESTIKSALNQNDEYYEVIVVDDGSTDNTPSVIMNLKDNRIKYIRKNHTNAPDTRNRCIHEANGNFILWLDSDDILTPNLLSRFRYNLSKFPDIDVCYGDIVPFGDLGKFPPSPLRYKDYYGRNAELLCEMVYGNKIPNPGTFIKKDIYERIGEYDIHFRRAHDYEFWIRAAPVANFKHIGGISVRWRWHESNMSAGNKPLDTSYESAILSKLISQHPLETLFPQFDWENWKIATLFSENLIAQRFYILKDIHNYTLHLKKSVIFLHPQVIFPKNIISQLIMLSEIYLNIYNETGEVYFKEISNTALKTSNHKL